MVLAGFFVTNAIVAELIGGKLVQFFGIFTQSIGIILWPVVFILTDLINEHYGKNGVRKLTYITVGLIIYTFVLLSIAIELPAVNFSPVNDSVFRTVFGQSQWIIVGSITAFLTSQLIDVYIFWLFRNRTGGKNDLVKSHRKYSGKSIDRYFCCAIHCVCFARQMGLQRIFGECQLGLRF